MAKRRRLTPAQSDYLGAPGALETTRPFTTGAAIADDTLTGVISQHGSAKARTRWLALGLGTSAIKPCNTFTASADQVR